MQKNLPRGFSILKTDQIIDHFRRVSHCLHYLLHTKDKTDKTGPAFNKYFFSKDCFQTLHVAHKVGFYEGRSANVKAPAIEWIWAVKRNIWVGSKKFPTCLENILLKTFSRENISAWCPEPRICCTNSLTGPALHRTNKCSLRALNCRFRGTFCEFITRGTLCRVVQVAFFCVWGRDRIGEAAAGWKIMFARQLLDSTDWGLVHTLDCCPAFHCAAACCSEAKYRNCDPVFQCCKLQRVTSSGRKKAAFCSISSLYSCPTLTVHVYATQPGSNTHSCLNSKTRLILNSSVQLAHFLLTTVFILQNKRIL